MSGAAKPAALAAAIAAESARAHADQLAAARAWSQGGLARLPRRALSVAVAFALQLQRAWPEHNGRDGARPALDGEVPQDGQAEGSWESQQVHGGHGAATTGARK